MSTDKHGNWQFSDAIPLPAKNYPADFSQFSAIFVVFNLPEVNMIGSRVTVDAPRERKQLGAFVEPSRDSRLPERKRKRLLRRLRKRLIRRLKIIRSPRLRENDFKV